MNASLHVRNDLKYLPLCTNFAESFAELADSDAAGTTRIVQCVEEAFCHVVEGAYEKGEDGEIILHAEDRGGLEISLQDPGLPFDRSLLASYDSRKAAENADLRGLGLFLIQKNADEVRWENLGRGGNLMRMRFARAAQNVTETEGGSELKVLAADVPLAPEQEYTIRLAAPADAVHICRCIYRAYGYSYISEDMYYPDRVAEKIASGNLISVVAIAADGEVVGHVSLAMCVPGILVESGQAVVNPAHRGRNLLEKMKDVLNARGAEIGLTGIFSEPVAVHPRSQKASLKTGNHSCGLTLAMGPDSLNFKKLDTAAQRVSCAYNYMQLKPWTAKTVHVTPEFADLVAEIYSGCGLAVSVDAAPHAPDKAASSVVSRYSKPLGTGSIALHEIGADAGEAIKQGLLQLTMKTAAAMVYLDLPLEDPACGFAAQKARELGFVFCAVAVAADGGRDVLRLQYVNCDIDTSRIVIVGDTALKIFAFIKHQLGVTGC